MLLLAGYEVLLARYSGQEDVLVGSPVANRNRAETEGLIGFFVNTLVLRVQLGPAASFRDALRQAREAALAAYGHQDLPFETLVEELRPERDLSRSPFFQELLSVQTAGPGLPGLGEVKLEGIDGESTAAKFDLSLFVIDAETTLRAGVEYNIGLFEAATAVRLLGHIGRLLEAAVSDPERGWRDLPLLTESEREQLLAGFNDTGATSGPELCLHQLFEAQAERTPERTALVAPEGTRWTYRELNERAERLAHRLRALGLGPERLAGVLMDRTADLVVTLLAVHKAGGAYAPLDPNYPQSRVLLMLETSQAAVLVTRRGLAAALEGDLPAGMRTVFLDPGWEMEPVESVVSQRALPDNLAYVIFTSGSTGVPKGVAIQHRSAVAMVCWAHCHVHAGGVRRRAGLDLDLFRYVGVRDLRHPGRGRQDPAGRERPGFAGPRGPGRGGAGRYGAVGDVRAAAAGPPAGDDPDGKPGRRGAEGVAGAGDLWTVARGRTGGQPLRSVGGYDLHLLRGGAARRRAPVDRPSADGRSGLRPRRRECGRCRSAFRARCTWAGKG